ncbi:MAG: hypothetical protein K2R98_24125 [Gemmataceae bacterium]|nr:hypothetical protein [Gemmataceae bacterium]
MNSMMRRIAFPSPAALRPGLGLFLLCAAIGCGRGERVQLATTAKQPGPIIRLIEGPAGHFEVAGVSPSGDADRKPDEWNQLFAVYVDDLSGSDAGQTPVMGSHQVKNGVLSFKPRFSLREGVRYRAVYNPSALSGTAVAEKPVVAFFSLPKADSSSTTVVANVYPSCDELPENQLKFYINFTAPMSRGEAYQYIRLLDADNKPVDSPFLELDEELWDPQCRRFTLFFDPGRIKRGLKPREEVGPTLEEGKSYTLVIDKKWMDARGNPMKETYKKPFRVGKPDDTQPDPKNWKLSLPTADTVQPLTVAFPKPLDHGLLQRLLWVVDASGNRVPAITTLSNEEKAWHFTPLKGWKAGKYELMIDTALEDLAGNKIDRPFEVDIFEKIDRKVEQKTVKLPFEVKEP